MAPRIGASGLKALLDDQQNGISPNFTNPATDTFGNWGSASYSFSNSCHEPCFTGYDSTGDVGSEVK